MTGVFLLQRRSKAINLAQQTEKKKERDKTKREPSKCIKSSRKKKRVRRGKLFHRILYINKLKMENTRIVKGKVEEFVTGLPMHLLCRRGRIVLENTEPFFIISVDGPASALLYKSSSALSGRRLKSIDTELNGEQKLVAAAGLARSSGRRVFLTMARSCKKEDLIFTFQSCLSSVGDKRMEILLFPMDDRNKMSIPYPKVDREQEESSSKYESQVNRASGRDSPDKDLGISDEEMMDSHSGDEAAFDYAEQFSAGLTMPCKTI